MNSKIQSHHQQKTAFVYLRQSTMHQVMHNQESTERQYALSQKAIDYGWSPSLVQVLDGDLGRSGSNTAGREDFKTLVAEVSMGKVGAIFVLEASRLSRSSADWNRLLELCSLTQTLIIDQDGCYDPAQFNDQLLLGLKGTMSQAELHLIRARLYGAKINKAKKGELRFPLPVGYVHDDLGNVTFDPDAQVCHVIQMVFDLFKEKQSAYAVVQHFGQNSIKFPKRSYGGRWKGKLIWGRVTYERVLSVLCNPFYAGVYTWGRHKSFKIINPQGEIVTKQRLLPMEEWPVMIKDHHCKYISFQDFENNRQQSQTNRLVAASLEKSWNQELEKLAAAEKEFQDYLSKQEKEFPAAKKKEITALASHIPVLWDKTTNIKDKKRIIRLLIRDITVTRDIDKKT